MAQCELLPACMLCNGKMAGDPAAAQPFVFSGVAPAAWDDITVDPAENAVTITVTTPSLFSTGDWIKIKDNRAPYSGSGTHWETNQVRKKDGSVLTLEFPLSDSYATISTVKPSVSKFTPVVQSGLVGPGKISNGSATDASIGNAGVRFSHAVAGYVRGAEFFQCEADGFATSIHLAATSRTTTAIRCPPSSGPTLETDVAASR